MNDQISSVRPANQQAAYPNEAPAPLATPNYEYRRRANERFYEPPVTSVHAVGGPPEKRCWVERQQVNEDLRGDANVGGAVLGHQVGSGRGNDAATAGGAAAGQGP